MIMALAIPPERPIKNEGVRNVPIIREPTITLRKATVKPAQKSYKDMAVMVSIFANPNLSQGTGVGMAASMV